MSMRHVDDINHVKIRDQKNPGRLYLKCPKRKCKLFQWINEPPQGLAFKLLQAQDFLEITHFINFTRLFNKKFYTECFVDSIVRNLNRNKKVHYRL